MPRLRVVDDAAEIVGRRAVGLDQDLVLDVLGLDFDPAMDQVVVGDFPAGDRPERGSPPLPGRPGPGRRGILGFGPVEVEAAALMDGLAVPIQAEPTEVLENLVEKALFGADLVGVLDPKEETAARLRRSQPVEEGRPGAPQVQKAGRTRGKTDRKHRDFLRLRDTDL